MEDMKFIQDLALGSQTINRMREHIELVIKTFISFASSREHQWSRAFLGSERSLRSDYADQAAVWTISANSLVKIECGHRYPDGCFVRNDYSWFFDKKPEIRMLDVQGIYEALPILTRLMRDASPHVDELLWMPLLRAAVIGGSRS